MDPRELWSWNQRHRVWSSWTSQTRRWFCAKTCPKQSINIETVCLRVSELIPNSRIQTYCLNMKRMEFPWHTGSLSHIYCCTRQIMENGAFRLIKTGECDGRYRWHLEGVKKAIWYLKNTEENVIEVFTKCIWHCCSFSEHEDSVKPPSADCFGAQSARPEGCSRAEELVLFQQLTANLFQNGATTPPRWKYLVQSSDGQTLFVCHHFLIIYQLQLTDCRQHRVLWTLFVLPQI